MRLNDIVQVYPSRITITPPRQSKGIKGMVDSYHKKLFKDEARARYEANFKQKAKDFNLSKASKRKIFDSINSMYCLSKPRTIQMQNGKQIFKFRLAFLTLTLPSPQEHSDTTIKKELINQFLVELKRKNGVNNFVWKAELQANSNIHFHLIIDKYVDFQAIRRRWNRIINKLGYVDAYQAKFKALSLSDYNKLTNANGKTDFSIIAKRYAAGCKSNWSNPNTVDVKSVHGKKDLAIYLGKYVAKNVSKDEMTDELKERLEAFGRTWSRSYSLAQLKFIHKYLVSEIENVLKYLDNQQTTVRKVVGDWFTAYYFSPGELNKVFQQFHNNYMHAIAHIFKYPIPI